MRPWILFLAFIAGAHPDPQGTDSQSAGRITTLLPGLLGNLMFDYAVLLGIADSHRLQAHLSLKSSVYPLSVEESAIRRARGFAGVFGITFLEEEDEISWQAANATLGWGRYDPSLLQIAAEVRNPRLNPSFSFKYFEHLDKNTLRDVFRFPQYAEEEAASFLNDVRSKFEHGRRITIAGIHVRRGDKQWEFHMFNQWSHDTGYVVRAMQVLWKLYGEQHTVFIIATDDPDWAQAVFGHLPRVVISPHRTPPQCKMDIGCQAPVFDMTLLARTDAVVVSGSSTYSWWAGFLASDQAVVIAPRLPVNPSGPFGPCESEHQLENPGPGLPHARCREYWSEDFFPPDWILLDEDPARDVYPAWWGPHVTLLAPRESGGRVEPGPVVLLVRISHLSAGEVTCVYMEDVLVASLGGEGSGLAEVEAAVGSGEARVTVGACVTEGQCGVTAAGPEGCAPFVATLELHVSAGAQGQGE